MAKITIEVEDKQYWTDRMRRAVETKIDVQKQHANRYDRLFDKEVDYCLTMINLINDHTIKNDAKDNS